MTDQMKQVLEKDKNQLYLDDYCHIDLSDYDIDISDRSNKWIGDRLEDAAKHFFDKGVNSYCNNVWHKASHDDMPQIDNAICLIYIKDQNIKVDHVQWSATERRFKYGRYGDVHFGFVDKWAYLEDLLPDAEGGES